MSGFAEVFKNRKAFIGYLTAGHGGIDFTVDAAIALVLASAEFQRR